MKIAVTSIVPFSELLDNLIDYLIKKDYHLNTISRYRTCGMKLSRLLQDWETEIIDSKIYDQLIDNITKKREYKELSRADKATIRCLDASLEFAIHGGITFRSCRKKFSFHGSLGDSIRKYLDWCKDRGLASTTRETKCEYLIRFQDFIESKHITEPENIQGAMLITYCLSLGLYSKATTHCMLSALRGYLKYLHEECVQSSDLSYLIPKDNYKKQAKLPTDYSNDEIQQMLSSIDRANPKGKRDYAMILLAALLGMRASDVCDLQFQHLDWEHNVIRFRQKKTKQAIELPLLTDIGNALIDYLRYARPESDSPFIFLYANGRYLKLNKETFHSVVTHYLRFAGIDTTNKKHGPHALRHSFASRLLDAEIPLPVISEALGHHNSDTSMLYLRIDLSHLKQCALEVPDLKSDFYGG